VGKMAQDLRAIQREVGVPSEPDQDWLAGVYLANATRFQGVEEYWLGMQAVIDRLRTEDTALFHDRFATELASSRMGADTAQMLVARADAGFLAQSDARLAGYDLVDGLVQAALNLHVFLVENEAQISYEPAASGLSRDPVLEAVPSSEALGDQMWDLVNEIPDAMDALGRLDKVTTAGLMEALIEQIRKAGIR